MEHPLIPSGGPGNALRFLRPFLGAAAVIALLIYLGRARHALAAESFTLDPLPIAGSWIFLFASALTAALAWKTILKPLLSAVSFRRILTVYHLSMILRWVPGKIWHLVGRVDQARDLGLTAPQTGQSVVAETLIASLAALTLSLGLPAVSGGPPLPLLAAGLALFALIPLFGHRFHPALPRIPLRTLLASLAVYLLYWTLNGAALFFTLRGIHPLPADTLRLVIGANSLAWLGGMFAFVVPNGLGVREGILAWALSTVLPVPIALVGALVFRFSSILFEALFALILYALKKKRSEPTHAAS